MLEYFQVNGLGCLHSNNLVPSPILKSNSTLWFCSSAQPVFSVCEFVSKHKIFMGYCKKCYVGRERSKISTVLKLAEWHQKAIFLPQKTTGNCFLLDINGNLSCDQRPAQFKTCWVMGGGKEEKERKIM